jgi:hypothetical protein
VTNPAVGQDSSHFDGAPGRVTAIGIGQQGHVVPQGLAHGGDDLLGAPWPFVLVMADFGADPELESVEAEFIPQPQKPRGLVLRRDAALHGRGVGTNGTRLAADQFAHASAFQLAAQIPQRRIEAGHGAHEIGAGKFVFAFRDPVHQGIDIERVLAQ